VPGTLPDLIVDNQWQTVAEIRAKKYPLFSGYFNRIGHGLS
jgi:hypothetical protein